MKKRYILTALLLAVCALFCACTAAEPLTELRIENADRLTLELGDTFELATNAGDRILEWSSSSSACAVDENGKLTALAVGKAAITVRFGELYDTVIVDVKEKEQIVIDADRDEFYQNYEVASSYEEAIARSEQGLMSGYLTVPDQAPEYAEHRHKKNGLFVRNTETYFEDENTYTVVDCCGEEVLTVFRGGAYITLEEVAAYLYAFGDVPANYVEGKNMEPESSEWGEYLRLNHSNFNGNTQKYPYEPELPNISGCGGELYYYEIDIGTTGTDCDPRYTAKTYNDGQSITRGAARIVYTRYDKNRDQIIDPNERYVFYTYNHYNDFCEYLNYYGGWGETFGNITGGGSLSSKKDYAPTPYVPTEREKLSELGPAVEICALDIFSIYYSGYIKEKLI